MAPTLVEKMAEWTIEFDATAVSREAVGLLKNSLLDAIGCAFITLDEDCVRGMRSVAGAAGGSPQATLIGGGKLPIVAATLVNGTLVRALDLNDHLAFDPNDGYKLGGHPSDNFAPLIAVAEYYDLPGSDLVAACLCAYELYGRIYRFLRADLPWDHTTAFAFSVAAAAARLQKLSAEKIAHAIALSGMQAATLGVVRRGQLSHAKFLASSLVTERAVQASLLAAAGFTGPITLFENSRGFNKGVFQTDEGLHFITRPLQERHMVEGVTIKAYPGMDTTQAAQEAAIAAAALAAPEQHLRAAEIARVELVMNDHPMTRAQATDAARRHPTSRETADHSYYYLVAVALLDGEVTPRQFADGRWFSPETVSVMERMMIRHDPAWELKAPGGFPCKVQLTMKDGRSIEAEVDYAAGHARNKMSRAGIVSKFAAAAEGKLTWSRVQDIINAVTELETLPSTRELTQLFCNPRD